LELTKWVSAKHNMGMAFNRDLWRKIHACRDLFCNFDDYNWDWSLEHISNNCIVDGLKVLLFKGPRVFHIGEW
jgi:alpha-1,6-mannosyl-glycoprotein beta-1,2-N-acetylglucosaminyltransferase